jgi:hypothetical protein
MIQAPGANVVKLFTAVIYHYSKVIPSVCVLKLYYLGNYYGMAVNYCSILRKSRVRITAVIYCCIVL